MAAALRPAVRALALLALLLVTSAAPAYAQRPAPADRTIDEVVKDALSGAITPGAVVAIVVRDSIAFMRAYGTTALDGDDVPLTADALFQAGGLSELVNALAAARLARAGKLELDAPLGPLIPELPRRFRDVTVDQLLTHTAGISYETAVPGRGGADDLGAAARGLTPLDRFAPGGTMYSFSTPGLQLVGLAIERAAKKPHAEAVNDAVLVPLGMLRSTFDFAEAGPHLTPGWHGSSSIAARLQPASFTRDVAMSVPLRGFHTTATDAARLVIALLNDGVVDGERVLPEGVAASLLQPRADVPFSTSRAGRGLRLSRWRGHNAVRIAGGSTGHSVSLDLLPAQRLGVIVLTNRSGRGLRGVADFVFRRLLGDVAAQAAPAPVDASADTASLVQLASHTGRYLNGAELIEIVARDGIPLLTSGDLVLPIRVLHDGAFGALIDNRVALIFRMFIDDGGRPWLWINDRALGREVPR
jgi:CubicO group peptidase (beta-lactamase class C family)